MKGKLVLKAFSKEHIDLLFRWANDSECRRNSFQSEPILYESHVKWCYDKLNCDDVDIFIAYLDHVPVGQLRLMYEKNKAMISYSVDSKFRGQGLGSQLILSIEVYELYKKNDITELVGKVKDDNIASKKVFESCGYKMYTQGDYFVYNKVIDQG